MTMVLTMVISRESASGQSGQGGCQDHHLLHTPHQYPVSRLPSPTNNCQIGGAAKTCQAPLCRTIVWDQGLFPGGVSVSVPGETLLTFLAQQLHP